VDQGIDVKKDPAQWNKVLCMCLSGVGDALTFTPFIRLLKEARPGLRIEVLVMFSASRQMMENNPDVSTVHFIDFIDGGAVESLRQVLALRGKKYDATIAACPANRAEYNIIQMLLGGRRIGHRYNHYDRINLNWLKQDWVSEDETRHVVENNVDLLRFCGVSVDQPIPPLQFKLATADFSAAGSWRAKKGINGRKMIGLHAGSALFKNHINKRWPKEKFAELSSRLVDEFGVAVLVFGGPEEKELKQSVVDLADRGRQVIAVDGLKLPQSAALMQQCECMVTNDSALMHISAAVQTPVVAIFGYTNPKMLYPWGSEHRLIRHELPCSPCFFYSPKPATCHANLDYACIKGIEVEEVFNACCELVENRRR
jgi:heptosyltransferase-2